MGSITEAAQGVTTCSEPETTDQDYEQHCGVRQKLSRRPISETDNMLQAHVLTASGRRKTRRVTSATSACVSLNSLIQRTETAHLCPASLAHGFLDTSSCKEVVTGRTFEFQCSSSRSTRYTFLSMWSNRTAHGNKFSCFHTYGSRRLLCSPGLPLH
jgi:hypothetical protein